MTQAIPETGDQSRASEVDNQPVSDPLIDKLPRPHDDGAAAHLPGLQLPAIELPSTHGGRVGLSELVARTVVFVHPSIGGIDDALLEGWTAIPGARGCTPEACAFRDQLGSFRQAGADVLGLSGQTAEQQRDAVERLGLPYPLLSDEQLELAALLGLPTFEFNGQTYFKRITLVVSRRRVEAALYPVFPPNQGAEQALAWLAENSPN
jgi:peroxiredoxin